MRSRVLIITTLIFSLLSIFPKEALGIEYVASFGGKIRDAQTYRNHAYLAQRNAIRIIDISNKSKPKEVGTYSYYQNVIDKLAIKWPVIFFREHEGGNIWEGVRSVNVADSAHPMEIKNDENFYHSSKVGLGLEIESNTLVIATAGIVRSYDITNPCNPVQIIKTDGTVDDSNVSFTSKTKSLDIPPMPMNIVYSGSIHNVQADGNIVYLDDGATSLTAIDATQPDRPKYIGFSGNSRNIHNRMTGNIPVKRESIAIDRHIELKAVEVYDDENEFYLGKQLKILDTSIPDSTKTLCMLMSTDSHDNRLEGLWLNGSLLFVITSWHNTGQKKYHLFAYDLKKITDPKFMGSYPQDPVKDFDEGLNEFPAGISVSGDMIFIAGGDDGLIMLRFDKPPLN